MKYLALILLAGCSVGTQTVANHPPVIHKDIVQFGTTYGSFKVNQVSVFLWPANMTEDETAAIVAKINGASLQADPYMVDAAKLGVEASKLSAAWDGASCIDKYAVLEPGQDPMDVDTVTAWKADKDVSNPSELKMCQDNQARRKEIPALQDKDRQAALPFLSTILTAIDPDPAHPVNTRALDVTGTRIAINADGTVYVSLGNFLIPGNNPSTSNGMIRAASYIPSLKVLLFATPEIDAKGSPTGLIYTFALERGPDNGPLARFVGDMNLIDGSGKIVRYGSARIDAFPPQ